MPGSSEPIIPREMSAVAAPNMMNETVYLFALSLPDLLDRIVADRDEVRVPVPQPAPALERSEALWM
jgi:hypothetical protein